MFFRIVSPTNGKWCLTFPLTLLLFLVESLCWETRIFHSMSRKCPAWTHGAYYSLFEHWPKFSLVLKLLNGKMTKVPVEVALLMKVGAGPQNTSSNVTPVLLEWLDSVNELIMVFERQKKTINLDVYLQCRNRFLHESEVKVSEW